MNCLNTETRAKVISCLIEGCSIRATVRMTGVAKNTVVKLLADIGCACAAYHNQQVRNLKVRRLQADEIWCFGGAKAKNVRAEKKKEGWGDIWTWIGLDADTKLVVSYLVGGRDGGWATEFMEDCASRIHQTLKVTPAMEAGLTDHVWSLEEICALLPKPTVKASNIEKETLLRAVNGIRKS